MRLIKKGRGTRLFSLAPVKRKGGLHSPALAAALAAVLVGPALAYDREPRR